MERLGSISPRGLIALHSILVYPITLATTPHGLGFPAHLAYRGLEIPYIHVYRYTSML